MVRSTSPRPKTGEGYDWNSWVTQGAHEERRGELQLALKSYNHAIRIKPTLGSVYASRAHVKERLGNGAEALLDYDESIRLAPSSIKLCRRARLKEGLGDVHGALSDYDVGIDLDASFAVDLAGRARVKYMLGDHDGAFEDCDRAIKIDPTHAEAHLIRGITRQALRDPMATQSVLFDLECALALDPGLVAAYSQRGRLRMSQGDLAGARGDLEAALRFAPASPGALVDMGDLKQRLGRLGAASSDYDAAIRIDPLCANAYNRRGKLRVMTGDETSALSDFDRAIRADPKLAAAYVSRAGLRRCAGHDRGALEDCDEALRLNPAQAAVYNMRGKLHLQWGDNQSALADFGRAIDADPAFASAYYNRATVEDSNGAFATALQTYEHALFLNGDDPRASQCRARSVQLKRHLEDATPLNDGRHHDFAPKQRCANEAEVELEFHMASESYAQQHYQSGRAKAKELDLEGARRDYDIAIHLAPECADAYIDRGEVRRLLGDIRGAMADLEQAMLLRVASKADNIAADALDGGGAANFELEVLDRIKAKSRPNPTELPVESEKAAFDINL